MVKFLCLIHILIHELVESNRVRKSIPLRIKISFIYYLFCRKSPYFSTICVNNNNIFNKVCLDLLNDMTESETNIIKLI